MKGWMLLRALGLCVLLCLPGCREDLRPDLWGSKAERDVPIGMQTLGDSVYVKLRFTFPGRRPATRGRALVDAAPTVAPGSSGWAGAAGPASGTTRSGLTDEVQKGTAGEYAYYEAILALYVTSDMVSDEAQATLHSAYLLSNLRFDDGDNEERVATYVMALSRQKVETLKVNQMHALVILNPRGLCTVHGESLYCADGVTPAPATFGELSRTVCTDLGSDAGGVGMLMSNAPMLSAYPGGSATPRVVTLADIKALFFTSAAARQAADDETTTIIIERAAAKVTVALGSDPLGGSPMYVDFYDYMDDDPRYRVSLGDVRWTIDNYNRAFYLVRQADADWADVKATGATARYRMAYPVATAGLYRLQWGRDINYDNYTGDYAWSAGTATGSDQWDDTSAEGYDHLSGTCEASVFDSDAQSKACTTEGNSWYVAENTFSERCLTKYNTTRVVVRVGLRDYAGNALTGYYSAAMAGQNKIFTTEAGLRQGMADWYDDNVALNRDLSLLARVEGSDVFAATAPGAPSTSVCTIVDGAAGDGTFTFAFNVEAPCFKALYTAPVGMVGDDKTAYETAQRDKVTTQLTTLSGIVNDRCYHYGQWMYYASYIAHFGSRDTPWNTEEDAPFTTRRTDTYCNTYYVPADDGVQIGEGDPSNIRANWLGRWGVVRDHWYRLTLTSLTRVGLPNVPDPDPDEPDDQVDNPVIFVPGYPINWIDETPQW